MANPAEPDEALECIEDGDITGCEGPVEYRMNLSGTGVPTTRCDKHWAKRLEREQELRQRYPEHPPADWSPMDAGESWYEDE